VLDEEGVDYVVNGLEGSPAVLFQFPLPDEAVADIFHAFQEQGLDDDAYAVLTSAEIVSTANFEELRSEHSRAVRGLAPPDLLSKIRSMQWPRLTYYVGTILSVVAAAVGLLTDSPAVTIGAMVIAPQVSSALSASMGALLGDWRMLVDSVRRQGVGLLLAVLAAGAFGVGVRWISAVPPSLALEQLELMGLRLGPTVLSTIAALVAGAVGAFGFTTRQATSLVGVMIAAAIVPAAAAVGLAAAWGMPLVAVGALLLLLVNVLAVNVSSFLTYLAMGYRPAWQPEGPLLQTVGSVSQVRLAATVAVVALLLVGTTALAGQHLLFQQSTNEVVESTMNDDDYRSLSLTGVSVEYGGTTPIGATPNVTVTVSQSTNQTFPDLANTLERRIEERTGRNVTVSVAFSEIQRPTAIAAPEHGAVESRPAVPAAG
jgi:uncharacterized hydrophobic protein (TIGR00271 family)